MYTVYYVHMYMYMYMYIIIIKIMYTITSSWSTCTKPVASFPGLQLLVVAMPLVRIMYVLQYSRLGTVYLTHVYT